MKPILLAAAIVASAIVITPAVAAPGSVVNLPAFDDVGLSGSGVVNVRHGAQQQVVIREGNLNVSELRVERWGSLHIRACRQACPPNYRLVVDVTLPQVGDLAVQGSGLINVGSGFAPVNGRDIAVSGSGAVDARTLKASEFQVAVSGSGAIHVGEARSIEAAISGSGRVGYAGNPTVSRVISGSGWIGPER